MNVLQVLIDELGLLLVGWIGIVLRPRQLGNHYTFLHFGHDIEVLSVVNERIFSSILSLAQDREAHVSFAHPRVNFIPIQKLLVHNCLDSLL